MTQSLPEPSSLPFLFDGDGLILHLRNEQRHVYLLSIDVFPNNENVTPTSENFLDLTPEARRAVIAHVNRKYPGKVVHV